MNSDASDCWRITVAVQLLCGEYSVELERGDELALAMVELVSRHSSSDPYRDPAVCVQSCTDQGAREWLEAEANERAVWRACEFGVRGAA